MRARGGPEPSFGAFAVAADDRPIVRLRPPVPDDVAAVLAVLVARDLADHGVSDHKLDDLKDEWRSAGFEPALDGCVALDDTGNVCGWGQVGHEGAFAAVAPAAEARGIGSALLAWCESRAGSRGRSVHRQLIAAPNRSGATLLQAAGYTLARSNHVLRRELDGDVDPVAPPAGVELRTIVADADGPALQVLDAVAFAVQPGFEPESPQAFGDEHLRAHDLDPELSLVAEGESGPVGFLLTRRREPEHIGHVDLLAVHPDLHGRGVGSALLGTAISMFAAVGLAAAELVVSSANPTALRLYERHGLRRRFQFDIYEKPLIARSGTSGR